MGLSEKERPRYLLENAEECDVIVFFVVLKQLQRKNDALHEVQRELARKHQHIFWAHDFGGLP